MTRATRRPGPSALSPLALALLAAFPIWPVAAADDCSLQGDCQGNRSGGISVTAPPATLNVHDLTAPIQPAPGTPGIRLTGGGGTGLVVNAAPVGALLRIVTDRAPGITAASEGSPPRPANDALLNIPIPRGPGAPGGAVLVDSRSDITTAGAQAPGIGVLSSTTGFAESVLADLRAFDPAGITFQVSAVTDPLLAGTGSVGSAVAGRIGQARTVAGVTTLEYVGGTAGEAGSFTIDAEGHIAFDASAGFADLAVGDRRVVSVKILVDGYRHGVLQRRGEPGELFAAVTRTDSGLVVQQQAYFATFGDSTRPQAEGLALPDLPPYVAGLVRQAEQAGGAGGGVEVHHRAGSLVTSGATSHGISARSTGRIGGRGGDGGGFFTFGLVEPSEGGGGNAGGPVSVRVDSVIATRYLPEFVPVDPDPLQDALVAAQRLAEMAKASVGVLAHSEGGAGGRGGDGGTWYSGRRGGTGGDGGWVEVLGSGRIETLGHYASGILALSEGGDGGTGGDGGFVTDGSRGGFGGRGGAVRVDGSWAIATRGNAAHGIWAKSVGGNAGTGGSGGWLAGGSGQGGIATDGGDVVLLSAGHVDTEGAGAYGLFAQSVGGFGGSGGAGGSIFYSRGGSGDSAGSGGRVSIGNLAGGEVITHGAGSHAIYAQSIGGGGGAGGGGGGIVGVGGSGAAGGHGGEVYAANLGAIRTHGADARGLYAQSIGGGGGDGGYAAGLVALGGSGSGTSNGGEVTVSNAGEVHTAGSGSDALFAQSIGGGGGNGGSSGGWFAIGGKGGGGGSAGDVTVMNTGRTLQTTGAAATALYAQSAGGGGGKGGDSFAVGPFVSLAIGGSGALGGLGADVNVRSLGAELLTNGARSHGIFAQSLGGGGGDGGYAAATSLGVGASVSVALGGKAGGGNDAGDVQVLNVSRILTRGNDADGIFAESVGGGGGVGGFSVAAAFSDTAALGFSMGGQGGSGGDARTVQVDNAGAITTLGQRSVGLQAQSVGGGGGRGGFSVAATAAGTASLSLALGGKGDTGGDADAVRVRHDGSIETIGVDAYGLLAQSVGGGGGSGGFTVAASGAGTAAGSVGVGGYGKGGGRGRSVVVTGSGAIDTWGARAVGLFAQSVGGGGGNGGFNIAVAGAGVGAGTLGVGGFGAGGGDADTVRVDVGSAIHTRGASAYGLLAQSVGGGGGHGGFSIAAAGAGTGAGTLNLGGSGGSGSDGNAVTVLSRGAITTGGEHAVGLFAQSVGGGGGSGGFAISGAGAGTGAGTFSLGGSGNGGGNADSVTVTNSGRLVTSGSYAYGLLAQSVGGGGGSGAFSIAGAGAGTGAGVLGIGGFGALGGDGAAVTVTSTGQTTTYGLGAAGLLVQSVGGGGGSGGFSLTGVGAKTGSGSFTLGGWGGSGGDAAAVDLASQGAVTTYGLRAHGAVAQSVGGGGGHGGFSFGAGVTTGGFGLKATIGGFGGEGGDAGNARLVNTAAVTTWQGDAHGLVAQSIGGGGGNGGFSGVLSAAAGSKPDIALSVGGFGAIAGNAGERVELVNQGTVQTAGTAAYGLFAQSVGGGGGDGGGSLAVVLGQHTGGLNVAATYGGSGGAAGDGHTVVATNSGAVTTQGSRAHAIVAQSIGGGGGDGGFSVSGVFGRGTGNKDVALAIGGFAGAGGHAGAVTVTNTAVVKALGANASGIVAQSLGGGGGHGGFALAGSMDGAQAKDFSVSVGGSGGGAGQGRAVNVTNQGVIETGRVVVTPAAASAAGPDASLAGPAMGPLAAGLADLPPLPEPPEAPSLPKAPEALLVERHAAYTGYGILAQSLGGGGGVGGTSVAFGTGFGGVKDSWNVNVGVAVGGRGGSGNIAGAVTLTNESAVTTREHDSHALFAQSVGGGGGAGGNSFTATLGFGASNEGRSLNSNVVVGGFGGTGNAGGAVRVDNQGTLQTLGDLSDGIRAQGIGGGGGSGGSARSISLLLKAGSATLKKDQVAGANWKTQLEIGGNGGTGNDGGSVRVVNAGGITTQGASSRGIFAQSIGGGGGSGGDGIQGTGTAADSYLTLALIPFTDAGGKGISGFLAGQLRDLSLTVGGSEGSRGDGAGVTVVNTGHITTHGLGATAILAQSVGGGGGEAIALAGGEDSAGRAVAGALGKFAIGGAGGAGGDGGAVAVDHNAAIDTWGAAAHGIFAQSVGGGGGNAGIVQRTQVARLNLGLGLDFGRSGGGAGNGGAVSVDGGGTITTRGDDAHGIWAQSVGGGGGTASGLGLLSELSLGRVGLAGSVGGQGSGGVVRVHHAGDIVTSGAAAHGIFVQSAGGRQADDDDNRYLGLGGAVNVRLNGNINASGADADGIVAQSIGVAGRGNITVEIVRGTVRGGTGMGAGVRLLDGQDNMLSNGGNLGTQAGISGLAVVGTAGNDRIDNTGTLNGNVDLGAGRNGFTNRAAATLNAGTTLVLGSGNGLVNEGLLAPGGRGAVLTTRLDGNLSQTASGVYAVDVDARAQGVDRIDVTGSASLGGRVELQVRKPAPVQGRATIVSAAGGLGSAVPALDVAPSAVARYTLVPEGKDLVLDYRIDFADVAGLNRNQAAVGGQVNHIQRLGGTVAFEPLAEALFLLPRAAQLATAYDGLSPEPYAALGTGTLLTSLQFGEALFSCRVAGGESRFTREGECGWMTAGAGRLRQRRSDENLGFVRESYGLSGGFQRELDNHMHLGLGLGLEREHTDVGEIASHRGNVVQGGVTLKGRRGDTSLAALLGVGAGRYSTQRRVDVPVAGIEATSEPRQRFWAARLRLAHAFEGDDGYLRPTIDAGLTRVIRKGFEETGAGAASLNVAGDSHDTWTLKPAVEFGRDWKRTDGALLRGYLRLGLTRLLSGATPGVRATLQGAPAEVAAFTVNGRVDKTQADLALAVELYKANGTVLRLSYGGQFSRHMTAQTATAKVAVPF